jgi:hypothetical protein
MFLPEPPTQMMRRRGPDALLMHEVTHAALHQPTSERAGDRGSAAFGGDEKAVNVTEPPSQEQPEGELVYTMSHDGRSLAMTPLQYLQYCNEVMVTTRLKIANPMIWKAKYDVRGKWDIYSGNWLLRTLAGGFPNEEYVFSAERAAKRIADESDRTLKTYGDPEDARQDAEKLGRIVKSSERSINLALEEIFDFENRAHRGGGAVLKTLEITKQASFTVLALAASAKLAPLAGATLLGKMSVGAGASGLTALFSGAVERGAEAYILDSEFDSEALALDVLTAIASGALAVGLAEKLAGPVAARLVPLVRDSVPWMSGMATSEAVKVLTERLGSSLGAALEEALVSAIKVARDDITMGELVENVALALMASVVAGEAA